jgi:hypothetical protein
VKSKTRRLIGPILVCLTIWSCDTGPGWTGKYVAVQSSDGTAAVTLILEAGGKGQWIIDQEITLLQWEERSSALWLHFKTGGVVIARPNSTDQALTVEIPGADSFLLRKVQ